MSVIKISDVATAAGVSISTVSQVLNGNGSAYRIATKTIERVQIAARDLGFIPNAAARDLRAKRTGQIGLVMSGFQDQNIPLAVRLSLEGAFLMGLTGAARERGVPGVLIYPTAPNQTLEPHLYLDGRVDGLIVQNDPWGKNLMRDLNPKRIPVVGIWTQDVQEGMGFADVDHFAGAVLAVGHLLELGHQKIALYGPKIQNNSTVGENFRLRYDGYRQAFKQAGLVVNQDFHVSEPEDIIRLQRQADPITAVFAVSDRRAISLIQTLQQAGIKVPQDLSVVGFDDIIGADTVAGGLTTVTNPVLEISAAALENLIALIESKPIEACRSVIAPKLVIRNSTIPISKRKRK
jgi:LacI family transcriptional regulator